MTATVEATYSSVQGDGGGNGQAVTTGTEVDAGDWLVAAVAVSGNGTTITAPGTGTWTEITLPDNVITTSGGQIRVFKCINPADSTTYTWSFTNSRQSLVAALVGGADATNCVDVASSLESGVGTSHAPPSVTPGAASELALDFAFHRQFSPDTTNWSVPASGLTWTEQKDVQGADGNNNVRLALGTATAGASGSPVNTTAWTKTDANEEGLIVRILIKSAAGIPTGTGTAYAHEATTATGLKVVSGIALPCPGRAVASATGFKTVTASGLVIPHNVTASTGTNVTPKNGQAQTRVDVRSTGLKVATGTARVLAHTATAATIPTPAAPTTGALVGVESTGAVATGHVGGSSSAGATGSSSTVVGLV